MQWGNSQAIRQIILMTVQKDSKPRNNYSGCNIILMFKVCCMRGGGASILINKALINSITGMMDVVFINGVKVVKIICLDC